MTSAAAITFVTSAQADIGQQVDRTANARTGWLGSCSSSIVTRARGRTAARRT